MGSEELDFSVGFIRAERINDLGPWAQIHFESAAVLDGFISSLGFTLKLTSPFPCVFEREYLATLINTQAPWAIKNAE